MVADFEAVMQASKRYVDKVRQVMPVDKAVLFGSYAKGTADKLSDVDICFFLDNYGGKQRPDIIGELLRLTSGHKTFFEPIAFPTSEIYNDNPFVKEILRTGREIS
jgi:uncharacterized protein